MRRRLTEAFGCDIGGGGYYALGAPALGFTFFTRNSEVVTAAVRSTFQGRHTPYQVGLENPPPEVAGALLDLCYQGRSPVTGAQLEVHNYLRRNCLSLLTLGLDVNWNSVQVWKERSAWWTRG
jgi:hypothetical protein